MTTPTVDLYIETRRVHAQGWNWVQYWPEPCSEIVYTRSELLKVIRTYGIWASRMIRGGQLRITVQGRFSGRWLAESHWSDHSPQGEPWVHWPAWENLVFAAQLAIPRYWDDHDDRRLFETGGTDVSTLRLPPVR